MEKKQNLWEAIVNKLIEQDLTISTMESCTGGGIANEITSISGASAVLKESYITYCNEAKIKQGVPSEVISKYTVYSPETAIAMANAVKKQANSDLGIGVTGQLGRIDPNNPVDKLNHVWFAIIDQHNEVFVTEVKVIEHCRAIQKQFIIDKVANALCEIIC